ncbi:MAG: DnaJ domain-containing protein [Deltaproteobacteria bacterium]|nr:DnaJ domain-containing protein [Deltaproteobacteria bacterium]
MSSDRDDDYYGWLGIDAHADDAELRRIWRQLALKWHPDRAGPDTTHIFQKLLAAYTVLSDPAARTEYDRSRGIGATSTADTRRRAPGVLLTRLSRPLNILLASGIARRAEGDVIELFVDDQEATEGGMVSVSMWVPVRSPSGPIDELFTAWLAVPPGVTEGAVLTPSVLLPGMIRTVSFRVRLD